jgi:hypothetical protein
MTLANRMMAKITQINFHVMWLGTSGISVCYMRTLHDECSNFHYSHFTSVLNPAVGMITATDHILRVLISKPVLTLGTITMITIDCERCIERGWHMRTMNQ